MGDVTVGGATVEYTAVEDLTVVVALTTQHYRSVDCNWRIEYRKLVADSF